MQRLAQRRRESRRVDADVIRRIINRRKKRNALDVVPMKMREE